MKGIIIVTPLDTRFITYIFVHSGDLSKEKTEREKSDQVEKESRTQSDAQIKGRQNFNI